MFVDQDGALVALGDPDEEVDGHRPVMGIAGREHHEVVMPQTAWIGQ